MGEKLTFNGLFYRVEFVEIPIIQRDYAQGRKDEYEVRNTFLDALYLALTTDLTNTNQSLDLDFIYGNIDYGIFSVLDGQQRLTTLFLLHWFLAVKNHRTAEFRERFTINNKSRFTYKTRPSSTEFFDALTADDNFENKLTQPETEGLNTYSVSELISDSNWFYLSWKQDPTVQACLHMLDAIQKKFSVYEGDLYQRLINTETPYITFQFLRLESFGLSDELYIKMNARGKPLTSFENFKAKLEQIIESYTDGWPDYKLDITGFNDNRVDGYKYFIHKIDTHWADLFWPYRNLFSQDNTYDDELMNFIRLIILYQYLLDNKDSSKAPEKDDLSVLMGTGSKLSPTTISEYEILSCLNQKFIIRLIRIFDLIEDQDSTQKIKTYLPNQKYYTEEETFKKVLLNETSYVDKLRFFAFYSYLSKHDSSLDQSELRNWTRVISNLTENTIVDGSDDFYRALHSIEALSELNEPILDTLVKNTNITGFLGEQVLEERIKAHLLLKSEEWQSAIYTAENHPFFKGQIGFLLNFSGILAFYREHKDCNWNEVDNNQYLTQFNKYSESAGRIFSLIEDSTINLDYRWERAVLSKGFYFTKRDTRFNMLHTRSTKDNISRDHSWKRLLRIGSNEMETKQAYIKAVLDDKNYDNEDITNSLEKIYHQTLEKDQVEYWRKMLIEHFNIFEYSKRGFIELEGSQITILGKSQRNHYHSEFYTKVIESKLRKSEDSFPSLLKPFTNLHYHEVKSRYESAGLHVKGWDFDDQLFSIEITKADDHFNIIFKNNTLNPYPELIKGLLLDSGFERISPKQELDKVAHPSYFINTEQTTVEDVIDNLERLCEKLRNINDE